LNQALYESTEVLESFVGSVSIAGEQVEEGGEYTGFLNSVDFSLFEPQNSNPAHNEPKEPIGDLFAQNLMLALQFCQPYPGEEPMAEDDVFLIERFGVHRLSPEQHIIFDHSTDQDVLIESVLLEDAEFQPGLWYARKRHEIMGLDPEIVPLEEWYLIEMGDGLIQGATIALDKSFPWDFGRFIINEEPDGVLNIHDHVLNAEVSLPKSQLRDESFDLTAWYRLTTRVTDFSTAEMDTLTPSESETGWSLLDTEMKLSSNDEDDWSSMPDLKSVSNSEEEGVAPSGWDLPQPIYGDPEETFESRLHVWEQAIAYQDKRLSNPLPQARRIGPTRSRGGLTAGVFAAVPWR
jgi:hypothetical protein